MFSKKDRNGFEILNDETICYVLVDKPNIETIYAVLDKYLIKWDELHGDYNCPKENPDHTFFNQREMLNYFIENPNENALFFWNSIDENNEFMVGAHLTKDRKMILSITFDGDGSEKEDRILSDLKQFLGAEHGIIGYLPYRGFEKGKEFMELCNKINAGKT